MSRRPTRLQCGALAGLALLFVAQAVADEALRKQIRKQYRHQSYMLVEDADGAWLYLFDDDATQRPERLFSVSTVSTALDEAIAKTSSSNARTRVRGLTELAGAPMSEALDIALSLLADPDGAVRDEAAQLILDHPDGRELAAALGLVDEDETDE